MRPDWWVSWFQTFIILSAIELGIMGWVWLAMAMLVGVHAKWTASQLTVEHK